MTRWMIFSAAVLVAAAAHAEPFGPKIIIPEVVSPGAIDPSLPPVTCRRPRIVDIESNGPEQLQRLKNELEQGDVAVRLGPGVDLDFSGQPKDWFPITFGRCATLTGIGAGGSNGRTPKTPGPVLRYAPRADKRAPTFLEARCFPGPNNAEHIRIFGFRLIGPSFGHQTTFEVAIRVVDCRDVEISNMEIAGWGGTAVSVQDAAGLLGTIEDAGRVRVHGNFIHHNQHPTKDGKAEGYGVNAGTGGWVHVYENVFDFNRHAVAANGNSGGYITERNLILKGGGYHGFGFHTHQFDIHGMGEDGFGGFAGKQFRYEWNTFQYRKDNAIKIRGEPRERVDIANNIFPHPGLENDWGDDAINLRTSKKVDIGPGNIIDRDTFGAYDVCDFDGDGVDDLFLATGATWWFSSFGEFHWSYLKQETHRRPDIRLGYFDGDLRCDVLAEIDGQWVISSGGQGEWQALGAFGAPLAEIEFGRFDPSVRDHRPGQTRQTTHAFRRAPDGQWYVTPLTAPNWRLAQSSGLPLSKLRFGDFTGDGVTDVLAVVGGRWSISQSAIGPWRRLNAVVGDDLADVLLVNMDADDNIDDVLRLEGQGTISQGTARIYTGRLTWWRSKNGTHPWQSFRAYKFSFPVTNDTVLPLYGFAGRFGLAPGGGTMVIDQDRRGRFYSPAEVKRGAAPDWTSVVAY